MLADRPMQPVEIHLDEEVERALEIGLPGADSIEDETISTFARTELPHCASINTTE